METVRRMRAMASLCRQIAAYHPDRSWKLLAEAEYWEHMASAALLEQFKECTASSKNLMQQQTANSNDAHLCCAALLADQAPIRPETKSRAWGSGS
jgi:hypothetical protein